MSIPLSQIKENLTSVSLDILKMLNKTEKLSYKDIKERLGVSQNKVSKELARLEGALLITSKRDEVDSRIYNFSVTQYGVKILKK